VFSELNCDVLVLLLTTGPFIVVVLLKVTGALFVVVALLIKLPAIVVVPARFIFVNPSIVLVATTPFTFEVMVFVVDAKDEMLLEITELVATTPFIVVVRVLPDNVCVKEFIKFTTAEASPLIVDVNEFVVVEITFELIIVDVPIEPPTFEVKTLPSAERIFETERLETVKFEIVAFVAVKLFVFVVEAVIL
jgi:hypothetical protein